MSSERLTLLCPHPEATCEVARRLARAFRPGDCVLLAGPVGAGKTLFARCAIRSLLDRPEDVPSPSYTLVQVYPGRTGEIWHSDLYRLADSSEIEELGLPDAFREAITLVEWPDRLGPLAPADALTISFEATGKENGRELRLFWTAPKWRTKLHGIRDD